MSVCEVRFPVRALNCFYSKLLFGKCQAVPFWVTDPDSKLFNCRCRVVPFCATDPDAKLLTVTLEQVQEYGEPYRVPIELEITSSEGESRIELIEIDLRWGITASEAATSLRACLLEVERADAVVVDVPEVDRTGPYVGSEEAPPEEVCAALRQAEVVEHGDRNVRLGVGRAHAPAFPVG